MDDVICLQPGHCLDDLAIGRGTGVPDSPPRHGECLVETVDGDDLLGDLRITGHGAIGFSV